MNVQNFAAELRGGLIQQHRILKLETSLGDNVLLPHLLVGNSRLGRDFEFVIDVVSSTSDIELKKLIAQPVTLWMQQSDQSYAAHHGYVHTARRLGADGGLTFHQITVASWMHFLKFRRDQKIWQDKPVDAIVTDVFNAHPQARGFFEFRFTESLPPLSFCRQDETDWNFVHRLLESEGLFGFWKHDDDGKAHRLVITDRLSTLDEPLALAFYRAGTSSEADAMTDWTSTRTLQSTSLATRTFDYKHPAGHFNPKGTSLPTMPNQGDLPGQAEVYQYTGAYAFSTQQRGDVLSKIRVEEWESRSKRFFGRGSWRSGDAGKRFTFQNHPEHDRDPAEQREFAAIAVHWVIQNNLPIRRTGRRFPHGLDDQVDAARSDGAADTQYVVSGIDGSSGLFKIEVEAQRTTVPFRSPFEHPKPPTHLETAIVVGPQNEEVYTDELNRIKVHFVWDRVNGGTENASCWVRVAQSDVGGGYGAVHPPRVGEEVLIDYIGGDCDRPIAMARVYNGATKPQWHTTGLLSGYRSKEYAGAGYNQMVMDDSTGQNRVQLFSSQGNSLLHLGYLIQQTGNSRGDYLGSGFDLRTDNFGAVRANCGLYVTTYRSSADSQQLDVRDTQQQLVKAESLIEALSNASEAHRAENLQCGYNALKELTDATQGNVSRNPSGGRTAGGGTGSANAFKDPVMLFGSPSGLALSTNTSAHLSAAQHVNLVSGQSTHIAVGKSLIASVANKLSLFVQNSGMKLFAGRGKVEIQSHSDNIELVAQKTVKVLSTGAKIEVAADQEIFLTSGGAYIRIANGDIQIHAPGKADIKGSAHSFDGPTAQGYVLPGLPHAGDAPRYHEQFHLVDDDGKTVLAHTRYEIESESGKKWSGFSDANGFTQHVYTNQPESLSLTVYREVEDDSEEA
ncbi:type VI secretion system Vgr family protein [Burkholderia ubonensis]|uniref:Type VI secretion protein n=1 Tax=Burkholderia ubonensis subsp. mesacidophila TaxID=265293 RepID=A0A2A4FDC1_9BURK|nr:type VI secretion system Vgr family protein [Burkholderia ubonensis]PCE30339.1 type VI secretion protein [Burkholderia ubonensis subsp. mesacidophila]